MILALLVSAYLLANARTDISVTTQVGEGGTVENHIETSINGNTTTVDSHEPGTIRVVKTDESEEISAEPPITITPTPEVTPITKIQHVPKKNYWITLLHSLWARFHLIVKPR